MIDLAQKKFDRLTVLDYAGRNKRGSILWNCKCSCGNTCVAVGSDLLAGRKRSCGCLSKTLTAQRSVKDLSDMRFGSLQVLRRQGSTKKGTAAWLCVCDCGNTVVVSGENLRNQKTVSCGCKRSERHTTHGQSGTRLYRIWQHMKTRCNDPNHDHYQWYGGKGIRVCEEWNSFESFYRWAMQNGYEDTLTIDRVKTDGNYEPSNCRWISMKAQANNRSSNQAIEVSGKRYTLSEMAECFGMDYDMFYRMSHNPYKLT